MPPKKDKKKKEKSTKKEKEEERDLDRDNELKDELENLTDELEELKKRVNNLKEDNEWLEEEAQKVAEESQEYMSFMSKKANMRQNSIITLSDQNKKELENIKEQKEQVLRDFEEKKTNLQNNLISKQNMVNKLNEEIADMSHFKELKQSQLKEIEMLENEINEVRRDQTMIISELRSEFMKEKSDHKRDADNRIAAIVKLANREARQCLGESTLQIKMENQRLRRDLFALIEKTKETTAHKEKLDKQKEELLKEIKYADDLKKVRSTQQKNVIDKLFVNDDD